MELRLLRYFLAVSDYGSVAEAARRLHITQPALSRSIHDLEEEVGTPLFERSIKGVVRTAAGEFLMVAARQLLGDVQSMKEHIARIAQAHTSVLKIGISPNYGGHPMVLKKIHDFRQAWPGVSILLERELTVQQLRKIDDGLLDGGFMSWRDPNNTAFAGLHLFDCKLKIAVHRGSALMQGLPARLADLKDEPCIWFTREAAPTYNDFLLRQCYVAGLAPRIVQLGGDVNTVLNLVAAGIGYSVASDALAYNCPREVVLLDHPELKASYPVEFVWRTGTRNGELLQFIEHLSADAAAADSA